MLAQIYPLSHTPTLNVLWEKTLDGLEGQPNKKNGLLPFEKVLTILDMCYVLKVSKFSLFSFLDFQQLLESGLKFLDKRKCFSFF